MINTWKAFLFFGISCLFFSEFAFSVRVTEMISDPEGKQQKRLEALPHIIKANGASKGAVLVVFYDDRLNDAIFISASNSCRAGGIRSEDLFPKDRFEQEEALFLREREFPFELFNKEMLLIKRGEEIVKSIENLPTEISKLEKGYKWMFSLPDSLEEQDISYFKRYLKGCGDLQKDALEYLLGDLIKIHEWKQLAEVCIKDKNPEGSRNLKRISDWKGRIDLANEDVNALLVLMKRDPQSKGYVDKFESIIKVLKETPVESEFHKLFCHYCGKEAEDALIIKLFDNRERFDCKPTLVEIYGNQDPCFQCQAKLQWIVDRANSQGWELHLRYYSQTGFTGPCYLTEVKGTARFDDTETGMNVFTREKDKEGKILCFDFEAGSEIESICVYKYSASTSIAEVDDFGLEPGFFDEPVASSSSSSAPH